MASLPLSTIRLMPVGPTTWRAEIGVPRAWAEGYARAFLEGDDESMVVGLGLDATAAVHAAERALGVALLSATAEARLPPLPGSTKAALAEHPERGLWGAIMDYVSACGGRPEADEAREAFARLELQVLISTAAVRLAESFEEGPTPAFVQTVGPLLVEYEDAKRRAEEMPCKTT